MKKNVICLLLSFFFISFAGMAQGNRGQAESCAPMKNGKICYEDDVEMKGLNQTRIYNAVSQWANSEYGKDIFLSNILRNNGKKTIMVSSKIELLLGEEDKVQLKYRMYISCFDDRYTIEVKDLVYQYTSEDTKRTRSYPAETVIADDGKANTAPVIQNPKLLCDATFFFVEGLFGDVFDAVKRR